MWLETVIFLAWPAFATFMGALLSFHYLVTTLISGPWVSPEQLTIVAYSIGGALGISAVIVLLKTQLGASATPGTLSFVKVGLLIGAMASVSVPEGAWPVLRFIDDFSISREIFLSLTPLLCFAHFAFVGRANLFKPRKDSGHAR
jgi:hypothetical protein